MAGEAENRPAKIRILDVSVIQDSELNKWYTIVDRESLVGVLVQVAVEGTVSKVEVEMTGRIVTAKWNPSRSTKASRIYEAWFTLNRPSPPYVSSKISFIATAYGFNEDRDSSLGTFTLAYDMTVTSQPNRFSPVGTGECWCQRDITASDLRVLVEGIRRAEKRGIFEIVRDKSNKTRDLRGEPVLDKNGNKVKRELDQYDELGGRLFDLNMDEKLGKNERSYVEFAKSLTETFKTYQFNSCLRRIHFLAQCYLETQRFMKTYESNPSSAVSGGAFYRGRGLLQLTHDYNYEKFYQHQNGLSPTPAQLEDFVPRMASNMRLACLSAGWFWKKNGIHKYADRDNPTKVSAAINYPKALSGKENDIAGINHLAERKKFTNYFKTLFHYEDCKHL